MHEPRDRPPGTLRRVASLLLPSLLALTLIAPAAWADKDEDDDHDRCSDGEYANSYSCREVIVERTIDFDAAGIERRYDLTVTGVIPQLAQIWFVAPTALDLPALVRSLEQEPGVVSASRNQEFGSAECRQLNGAILELTGDWGTSVRLQEAVTSMNATVADATVGAGVTIAILDTGLDRSHPDLAGATIGPGIDLIGGGDVAHDGANGRDDNGDGFIDEGWGHGTAVAGLIHLVAPGARLLPVRILDDECLCTAFDLAKGIVEAVDAGAQILNVSLGAREESKAVEVALRYAEQAEVVVIASAGNAPESLEGEGELAFPAAEDESVAVSAVDPWLVAPAWTVADDDVTLSAPGVDLLTAYRGGYARVSGTSFSTAFVSAAAAAALAIRPDLSPKELVELLEQTAISVEETNPGQLLGALGAGIPDFIAIREMALNGDPDPRPKHGRVRLEGSPAQHAADHASPASTSLSRKR